jgi:hypothetical protein
VVVQRRRAFAFNSPLACCAGSPHHPSSLFIPNLLLIKQLPKPAFNQTTHQTNTNTNTNRQTQPSVPAGKAHRNAEDVF